MARDPEDWWPSAEQRAAATAPVFWTDTVEHAGEVIPAAWTVHDSFTFEASVFETQGPYGPHQASMSGWFSCGCGWQAAPPDPLDPRGEPVWTGKGHMAYYRHLPRGMLAYRLAREHWLNDNVAVFAARQLVTPPIGWALGDGPEDNRYRWWLHSVDVSDSSIIITTGG